jgi:RHS repeat-associated protein
LHARHSYALGNRIAHSRVSGAWTYDANNRLTQRGSGAGATSYQYDNAGNLTQKTEAGATTTYRYDTQNRLIEVALAQSGVTEQVIARYGYDPQDRRIWKEQYASKTGEPLLIAQRTLYLYSDQGLLAEAAQTFSSADASIITVPTITTQYGLRPGSPWGMAPLFIQTKNSAGQTSMAYYHHDQLGTPLQATDKAGNIVWAASFDAFGRASITTPQATVDKPTIASNLRLPGQYEDLETGLHYNWHRYYDAEVGRYVTSDPIGVEGGINRYSYVGGSPLSFVDPMGLYTEVIRWASSPGFTGSWGHISGNINGRSYSFGPNGWDTRYPTAQEYADRQSSSDIDREGLGIILDLSPIEEARLATCLRNASNYHAVNNNCGNPWLQCLDELGITHTGNRPAVLPEDVMKIISSSKRAMGNTSYSGKRRLFSR